MYVKSIKFIVCSVRACGGTNWLSSHHTERVKVVRTNSMPCTGWYYYCCLVLPYYSSIEFGTIACDGVWRCDVFTYYTAVESAAVESWCDEAHAHSRQP